MAERRQDRAATTAFGRQLRYWRGARGMSQLDLAVAARTTPRHVSFVETGRSRPGTDLVLRMADVLALPVRERNQLLAAAGLPAAHPRHNLDDPAMRPVRDIIDRVLRRHEPYPGWLVGAGMQFLAANTGADAVFPGLTARTPWEILDLWFGPRAVPRTNRELARRRTRDAGRVAPRGLGHRQ